MVKAKKHLVGPLVAITIFALGGGASTHSDGWAL